MMKTMGEQDFPEGGDCVGYYMCTLLLKGDSVI